MSEAQTLRVSPLPAEQALYADVTRFVKAHLASESSPLSRMALITMQKELGSSGAAAAATLDRLALTTRLAAADAEALRAMADRARASVELSKIAQLLHLLRDFPDQIVIFTQFRMTQDVLRRALADAGESVAVFQGGLTRVEKEAAIRAFQRGARILLSSEAGSGGRNLQFCHALCNFDLPWNPMRIEQRIGRLSRIGQTRDVHVFNLASAGTIEADVLHLLEAKINLFEMVIGEIGMILGNAYHFTQAISWFQATFISDEKELSVAASARLAELQQMLQRETQRIQRYFTDLRAESSERQSRAVARGEPAARFDLQREALDREEQAQGSELGRKMALRVQVRLLNVLWIVQPKLRIRVQLAPAQGVSGETEVVWDPALHRVEATVCAQCGRPTLTLTLTRAGQVVCPECAAAGVKRET